MTQTSDTTPTPKMEEGSEKNSIMLVLVAVTALILWIAKVPSGHPTVPRWQRLIKRFGLTALGELLATFPDTLDGPATSLSQIIQMAQQQRRRHRS